MSVHPNVLPGRHICPQVDGLGLVGYLVKNNIRSKGSDCGLFCPAFVGLPMGRGFDKLHSIDCHRGIIRSDLNSDYIVILAVAEGGGKGNLPGYLQRLHGCLAPVPGLGTGRSKDSRTESHQEKEKLPHFGSHLLSIDKKGIDLRKLNL